MCIHCFCWLGYNLPLAGRESFSHNTIRTSWYGGKVSRYLYGGEVTIMVKVPIPS